MIYLASPYSSPTADVQQQRYEDTMAFVVSETLAGHIIYSPILHWHPVALKYSLPGDIDFWRQHAVNMITKADTVWILQLPGWEQSRGVRFEIDVAKGMAIPTHYFLPKCPS